MRRKAQEQEEDHDAFEKCAVRMGASLPSVSRAGLMEAAMRKKSTAREENNTPEGRVLKK